MKKVFAPMVVFAALFAAGCAEQEPAAPPAEDQAAPVDETATDTPAEETAEETP